MQANHLIDIYRFQNQISFTLWYFLPTILRQLNGLRKKKNTLHMMFWKRLFLLLLACSFPSLSVNTFFLLSKIYDSTVKEESGCKTSCKVLSSLKIQTSVLHPLKTKYAVHLIPIEKKFALFMQHLPLTLAKCLQELQQETRETSFL